MNNSIFKSVAFAAKTRLNESGFDVRTGHIHEIIAALHGYRSNAAFRANKAPLTDSNSGGPIVVLLSTQLASDRVMALLPRIGGRKAPSPGDDKAQRHAAHAIATDVSECVEAVSTEGRLYLRPMGITCENTALKAYAREIALADPIMSGVVDDPEVRYQNEINEGFSEEIAEFRAKHLGHLTFPFGSCGAVDDRLFIEVSDEYSTVNEEHGVVRVYLEGRSLEHRVYVIDHARAEFTEGDYFDDAPEFDTFSNED